MSDICTFAIGDIHGYYDLMSAALQEIAARCHSPARVVFLGDYVDRGPQSKEVLEALMSGPTREGDEWVCLKGNHEDMMVQACARKAPWDWWIRNGGETTVSSYGGEPPVEVLDWCDKLPTHFETDDYYFVHAGVDPRRPLAHQRAEAKLWIRDEFLDHKGSFGKHIVHGHTPSSYAQSFGNRTNLDSGAFYTGRLSIGKITTSGIKIFTVGRP